MESSELPSQPAASRPCASHIHASIGAGSATAHSAGTGRRLHHMEDSGTPSVMPVCPPLRLESAAPRSPHKSLQISLIPHGHGRKDRGTPRGRWSPEARRERHRRGEELGTPLCPQLPAEASHPHGRACGPPSPELRDPISPAGAPTLSRVDTAQKERVMGLGEGRLAGPLRTKWHVVRRAFAIVRWCF